MTDEQETVLLIRGAIASMEEEDRTLTTAAYGRIIALEVEYGQVNTRMAVALRGAELAAAAD